VDPNSWCALPEIDGRHLSMVLTAIDVIEQSPATFRLARRHNGYGYRYWSLRAVQPRNHGRQKTIEIYIGNPPNAVIDMVRAKLNQYRLKPKVNSKLIQNEDHITRLKHQRAEAKIITENIAHKCGYYFRGYKLIRKGCYEENQ
jgi:hypothetical protein